MRGCLRLQGLCHDKTRQLIEEPASRIHEENFQQIGRPMRTNLQRLEGCDVPALPCGLHPCHMLWICIELTCRQVKAPSACSMQQPGQQEAFLHL